MTIPLTHPLHLYRALLRETTYLFDQNARRWTQSHIRASFRNNGSKVHDGKRWRRLPYDANKTPSSNERDQLKRGRKFLVTLQRANQGHQRHLRNVLQLTYGRKGRQKRALTRPLIQDVSSAGQPTAHDEPAGSEGAGTSTSDVTVRQTPTITPAKFSKEWRPSKELMSIVHAQTQLSTYLSIRKQIRLKTPVKDTNEWGRPMPPSRVKNIMKKWQAKLAGIVMPPIPENEWERLKEIAMRKQEFRLITRRPMAKRIFGTQADEGAEVFASAVICGLHGLGGQRLNRSIQNPHKLTPRFLSRFYARHILNHSPVAVPNPIGKGLVSKWDSGMRTALTTAKPKNEAQTAALFR